MNLSPLRQWRVLVWSACLLWTAGLKANDEPLHALVDRLTAPPAGVSVAVCSDAEFLRRVSFDLTGIPPTANEVRAFLQDAAPGKRQRMIEHLIGSPQFNRHLTNVFDVMLMERRPNKHVGADDWYKYLFDAVRTNKPWNLLVREILSADGDGPEPRAAARFFLDRDSEANLLTRDIGRIVFGRDLQCAQCHDHPLIDDYHQADYKGLLAFVLPGFEFTKKEGDKQTVYYAEKAGTDVSFESVFSPGEKHITGARLPDDVEIAEPSFYPGDEYVVEPAENVKPEPKFSRRAQLAERATNGSNRAFNENIANRLWAHMMGRALVYPMDLHHSENPPSHPELLRLLGQRFAEMNFDVRAMLRELALSDTYQRSFDLPAELSEAAETAAASIEKLQQRRATLADAATAAADAYSAAAGEWNSAETVLLAAMGEYDTARATYSEAKKKYDEAEKALADVKAQLAAKQDQAKSLSETSASAQETIKKLPDDKELAQAAAKFVEKAQAVAAEVAGLAKSADEKTAAVRTNTDLLESARKPLDDAAEKVKPLRAAMREKEELALEARRQMETEATALKRLDQQIENTTQLAALKPLRESIAAADDSAAARRREWEADRQQYVQVGLQMAQCERDVQMRTEARRQAADQLEAARQEHRRQADTADSVSAALDRTEDARRKLPDDELLARAAEALGQRTAQLREEENQLREQVDQRTSSLLAADQSLAAARRALNDMELERAHREQTLATAEAILKTACDEVTQRQAAFDESVLKLAGRWTADAAVAGLKPLTPEQLCWSILRVTGVYEQYRKAEEAELDKANPPSDEAKRDAQQLAARAEQLEQRTYDKLKGNVPAFVQLYASAAGQPQTDFFATADQALFAANGGTLNSWIAPAGGNLAERLINEPDNRKAADELYLLVLGRFPNEEEVTDVFDQLTSRSNDRPAAVQELIWGLLTSVEFRFNH